MEITRTKSKDVKLDRKPSTGIYGSPKKGGGGGKGTWGKGGVDDLRVTTQDREDPNYDSEEEIVDDVVITKVEVTSPTDAIIIEHFAEGDITETAKKLKEVSLTNVILYPVFVRRAMEMSMEKQPYERELISKLLSALYGEVIPSEQIAEGFQNALDRLEDLVLDVPAAGEMIGKFLARAIVDEIIPPAFLKNAFAESTFSKEAIALANGLITDHHRSKKLEHIWGPGDLESVKRLKEEVSLLVEEFLSSGDKEEADRCVRKLNAPSFHFQLVKQALRMAMAKGAEDRKKILSLLAFFSQTGLVVADHITQGFKACAEALSDIKLDAPAAPGIFDQIVKIAKADGWLSSQFSSPSLA